MSNCTKSALFSMLAGLLIGSLLSPADVANEAVSAENSRLIQAYNNQSAQFAHLQAQLTELAMASKAQLDKAALDLAEEKKRVAAQCLK